MPKAAEPAESTQRSKGADLAELLRETYADEAFTTTRYRYALGISKECQ